MEKNMLIKLVNESRTLSELLLKLNKRAAGSNFKIIKDKLRRLNIDFSHFNPQQVRDEKMFFIKKDLSSILTENSTHSRKTIKSRLYKEGLKNRECELCGQGEEWKGKKMSLILDHKNGVWNDNRIENLRIVCPNCNATLDTHGGRNVKGAKTKDDIDYRKVMTEKRKEAYENKRKVERPDLNVLLDEVENIGYSATGRKYGVSDNCVRKWIKNSLVM